MPDFTSHLPTSLTSRAFKASNGELAFNRADAIAVAEWLADKGYEILGVEVWIPSKSGPIIPMPICYTWDSRAALLRGGADSTAAEYIRTFQWDENDVHFKGKEPYFNFAV